MSRPDGGDPGMDWKIGLHQVVQPAHNAQGQKLTTEIALQPYTQIRRFANEEIKGLTEKHEPLVLLYFIDVVKEDGPLAGLVKTPLDMLETVGYVAERKGRSL